MKIVYPNGGIGVHMPYQYSDIKTLEDFEIHKEVWQDDGNGNYTLVGHDDCSIVWELADINYIAGEKIKKEYPEYKQLNILRAGTDSEVAKMNTFIDAVREWANSDNPDPWDGTLDSIIP
jgi:hypothetical protein